MYTKRKERSAPLATDKFVREQTANFLLLLLLLLRAEIKRAFWNHYPPLIWGTYLGIKKYFVFPLREASPPAATEWWSVAHNAFFFFNRLGFQFCSILFQWGLPPPPARH